MKHLILIVLLFTISMAACKKENPKLKSQILGRYAVAVEQRFTTATLDTTTFYNDTVTVTHIADTEIKITTSSDMATLQETPTGNTASLQYAATDSSGTTYSALFFNKKTIQFEVNATQNGTSRLRKYVGEKVSD